MARRLLSRSGSRCGATFFDIRLDDDYIVFRGSPSEASSAHLRGKVLLCLSEPLSVKHIKLELAGVSRVAAGYTTSRKKNRSYIEDEFFEKTWMFRDSSKAKQDTLATGNYEYPFDIVLEGSLPESIEGLPESFVIYRFKAEIGRKFSKDIVARKPLRIIRTMDSSALELAHAMTISNIWPNKIEYSISTPSKAIIYGTFIQAEFRLVSLLKGLKIGKVSTQVVELQEFIRNPEASPTLLNTHKISRVVATDEYNVPEEPEVLDEEAEGYVFSRHVELPKSLTKCVQDTEARGIKVRHRLKFKILLQNPDGHMSELRATLPVSLYISPSLAINDNNELVDQTPVAAQRARETDIAHAAPPLYQDHQLDQLYSGVDLSGFRTPGGPLTPATPFGTRPTSSSRDDSDFDEADSMSAAVLRARLQHLRSRPSPLGNTTNSDESDALPASSEIGQIAGSPQDDDRSSGSSQHSYSRSSSQTRSIPRKPHRHPSSGSGSGSNLSISRSSSQDSYDSTNSGTGTPDPQSLEIEELTRVPSYTSAMRAPAPLPSLNSLGLPSYGDATAAEASTGYFTHTAPLPLPAQIMYGDLQDEARRQRLMQTRVGA